MAIFLVVFLLTNAGLRYFQDSLNPSIIGAISAGIAALLSPRRYTVTKQSGKEVQLKWLFSKKIITFK